METYREKCEAINHWVIPFHGHLKRQKSERLIEDGGVHTPASWVLAAYAVLKGRSLAFGAADKIREIVYKIIIWLPFGMSATPSVYSGGVVFLWHKSGEQAYVLLSPK